VRILLTGAAGFIGSHLLNALQSRHMVFALDKSPALTTSQDNTYWLAHDLNQPLDLAQMPSDLDAIIHLAQSKHYRRFPERVRDIFGVNVQSTLNLLEYGREIGIERFIFASTGGVYGYGQDKFVETDPVRLLNFYATSKYIAELLINSYQQFFHTIILRFFFVYGPTQEGMLIPSLVNRIKDDELITVEGDPGIKLNPIYIDDVIRVFEPALSLPNSDTINVAGDESITISELIALIENALGKRAIKQHKDTSTDGNLIADNTRMKEVLGVTPQVSLRDGLSLFVRATGTAAEDGIVGELSNG
jgi:UDP-glucose 4-epimerase